MNLVIGGTANTTVVRTRIEKEARLIGHMRDGEVAANGRVYALPVWWCYLLVHRPAPTELRTALEYALTHE